jgi:hypothetical protein
MMTSTATARVYHQANLLPRPVLPSGVLFLYRVAFIWRLTVRPEVSKGEHDYGWCFDTSARADSPFALRYRRDEPKPKDSFLNRYRKGFQCWYPGGEYAQ